MIRQDRQQHHRRYQRREGLIMALMWVIASATLACLVYLVLTSFGAWNN